MKIILSLIVLLLSISDSFSQNQKPDLKISGNVKEIAMQEIYPNTNSALYITYIKLNLKLKNESSVPVIFLQPNPIAVRAEVFQSNGEKEIFLAKSDGVSSSFFMSKKEWGNLKTELDKPLPPKNITMTIYPNQELEFEGFIRLNILKSENYLQYSYVEKSPTLAFIQKHSPAEMRLSLETWSLLSLVINGKSRENFKTEFAQKLKEKWKNTGYLWMEEIEAEPISIDFNSVIFKTLID